MRDGKTHVQNGTYLAESAAGYAVYEAEGIEAAIALAARIPAARLGGAVEIRPAEKYLVIPRAGAASPAASIMSPCSHHRRSLCERW